MKTLLIIATAGLMGFSSCKKDDNENNNVSAVSISTQEKSDLIFLREEEKLAHNVYVYAFNKYGVTVFNNISASEASHMSSVLNLLNKYSIEDPVKSNGPGVFVNTNLQQLYNDLILQVDVSLIKALEAGATIEDLDISDIQTFYRNTSKSDLIQVYDALTCGSRNHIKAFTSQLTSQGVTYIPQYLTQSTYDSILALPHEQCGNGMRFRK